MLRDAVPEHSTTKDWRQGGFELARTIGVQFLMRNAEIFATDRSRALATKDSSSTEQFQPAVAVQIFFRVRLVHERLMFRNGVREKTAA